MEVYQEVYQMVQIENLTKDFDGFTALYNLNLNVKKGSIYGLVGINGSGKTTAIKHLAGLYRQDSGTVKINDIPVYDNARLKESIGYIPDDLYFFPQYNMRSLRKFYSAMYPKWNEERYRRLIAAFGLDARRKVSHFSKGMQKQAAFTFAMSIMPDVLLLDEPIDGLDPIVRKTVFQEIIDDVADREMTVLISSHNLKEMDGICDAIGIIKDGRMVIERDLDDLKSDVHKIQVAFSKDAFGQGVFSHDASGHDAFGHDETDDLGLEILHKEVRGSIKLLVVRGREEEVSAKIKSKNPVVYDRLPLTLEEIFIYETEGASNEFADIPY